MSWTKWRGNAWLLFLAALFGAGAGKVALTDEGHQWREA